MRIDVIVSTLPPVLDGIGDYTADMVARLARAADVRILTRTGQSPDAIAGVPIEAAFDATRPRTVLGLVPPVAARAPDWVLLQYNPFCFGKWGLNPYVGRCLRAIRAASPRTRVAVMVHETYVPFTSVKMTVMATWQRWQMGQVARAADMLYCSCESWTQDVAAIVRGRLVQTLPVGSNIGIEPIARAEARGRLGITDDQFVLGVFGVTHPSRMPDRARVAAVAVRSLGLNPVLLYLGPDKEAMVRELDDIPVIAGGVLPADETSRRFAAMDIYLAAYTDGVSCRRTAFMTGIQHGIATVGTHGIHTDSALLRENGTAFLLAEAYNADEFARNVLCLAGDAGARERIARAGAELYRAEFDRDTLANRLIETLQGWSG